MASKALRHILWVISSLITYHSISIFWRTSLPLTWAFGDTDAKHCKALRGTLISTSLQQTRLHTFTTGRQRKKVLLCVIVLDNAPRCLLLPLPWHSFIRPATATDRFVASFFCSQKWFARKLSWPSLACEELNWYIKWAHWHARCCITLHCIAMQPQESPSPL